MNSESPEQTPLELEMRINELIFQNMQLTRIMWQLTNKLGGKVSIDLTEIPQLWQLRKGEKTDDKTLHLEALTLPHPDEETIKKCADWLRGTKKDLGAAMIEFEFGPYPMPYIELRMAPYIRYTSEKWVGVK